MNAVVEEFIRKNKLIIQVLDKENEDIIMINSNERHLYHASQNIMFVKINIAYHLIRQVYNGTGSRFICNTTDGDDSNYSELRRILKSLLLSYVNRESDVKLRERTNYEYLSVYFHLLEFLIVHFLMYPQQESLSQQQKNEQRMMQIHDYIQCSYNQPISLQSLAEHLYLSEGYLSRYFKQNFHLKFTEYLKKVRLAHAMNELMYSDRTIVQIAYDNGFSSVSFFNKAFKAEYGRTPSSVRGHSRKASEAGTGPGLGRITEKLESFLSDNDDTDRDRVKVRKAEHSFSVQNCKKIEHIWNQVINIGSAADLLKNEIQEHAVLLHQALGYRYVRFWSIFSKEMLIDVFSDKGYNFAKLDQVLDFILEAGLIPFIDLEEKTKRINVSTESVLLYEDNPLEFQSIGQWERLIEELFRHFVKRYGVEKLSEWKIEVWYGGYCIAGENNTDSYFTILKSVQTIVKKYVPDLEVGGGGVFPGFLCEPQKNSVSFWKELRQRALKTDFITLMNYAYDPDVMGREHFGKKSTDERYLLHSVRRLKQDLEEAGITDVPVYVTEWNLTVSDRNYINDSCFQGAYIVKNVIDVFQEVGMIGYFTGSDRTSEYYDSRQLLHGGPGLLSKDGIMKPAAFAVEFLNHMYPYYIHSDDNFLATTDKRGNYGIVCHNMKGLSYYYYLAGEGMIEKEKVWRCFDNRNELETSLILECVENGSYQVKIHRINEKNGSVLDAWCELDYYPELSREDVKYFRRICEPKLTIKKCAVDNHKIEIKMCMKANEIGFIEIHKDM